MEKGDASNSLEDRNEKYSLWERGLPSAEELVPLNQSLVTPILACAFSIKDVPYRERSRADVEKAAQASINSIYESSRFANNAELNNNDYQQPHYPSVSTQSRGYFGSSVANTNLSNRFGASRERINPPHPFKTAPSSNILPATPPSATQGLGYGHESFSEPKFHSEAHYGSEGRFNSEARYGHVQSGNLGDSHLKNSHSSLTDLRTNHFLKNDSRYSSEPRMMAQSRLPNEAMSLDPSARGMEASDPRPSHHDLRNSETEQRMLQTDGRKQTQAELHLDVRGSAHAETSRLGSEMNLQNEEGRGSGDLGYGSSDGAAASMNSPDRGRQVLPLFERSRVSADMGQPSDSGKLNGLGLGNGASSMMKKSRKSSDGDDEEGEESADGTENSGDDHLPRTLKRPRLVWTPQLHKRFVDAVGHLGIKNAVPKTIMQLMNVEGLTRENVASHLQKYRLYLKRMQGASGDSPSPNDQLFASASLPNLTPTSHQLYLPNRHDDMGSYPNSVPIPNHMHGMNHDHSHGIPAQHPAYKSYDHVFNRQLHPRSPPRDAREYSIEGGHGSVPASPPQRVLSLFPSAS